MGHTFTFKSLMEELALMAKELEGYKKTGLTPEKMQEIDRLYAEKCRELAECKKQIPPCKIGDVAWAVRKYMDKLRVYKGIISEMYYGQNMELVVVVKNIAYGRIGNNVFLSEAEAQQAVERMKDR